MGLLAELYGRNLTLLTDLYELTMAYGYCKAGKDRDQAVFHLFFREIPFSGGYAVCAGLEQVLEYLEAFRFGQEEQSYLASLTGADGKPLFDREFLQYLGELRMSCDIDAMPEGTLAFANEPLIRIAGPIVEAQLIESALLNIVNFQTLIATKAARICQATRGEPVLEFGMRRAQGIDGAITAARAAYIGGCAATSNVLAGKLLGIPVKGTHAHSWVMSFDSEIESFDAYARAMPNNCVFLVDTYNTLEGVRNAIEAGKRLRASGHEMVGIRLDSGDLAYLSIEARKMLDAAGFPKTAIVASNDLDESLIESLKQQGATISVWGVGTRLITAYGQPALGGVYKLTAYRHAGHSDWEPRIKLSEHTSKTSVPGVLQVRRFEQSGRLIADMIYEESHIGLPDPQQETVIIDPKDPIRRKHIAAQTPGRDLLVPAMRGGKRCLPPASLGELRQRAAHELQLLHPTIRRLVNPHEYPVGLESRLNDLRNKMIAENRK